MFEDEAAFREDPTIYYSWFRRGSRSKVPTFGRRNTQHVYGAISIPYARFSYHRADTCNTSSHQRFLEMLVRKFYPQKIFLIEDNARYHKNYDMLDWYEAHRQEIEPWFLPPYSPELNPMEPVWGYVRREGTHNRFFHNVSELLSSVKTIFRRIQYHPDLVQNCLDRFV